MIWTQNAVALGPDDFIIPLQFGQEKVEMTGHYLLAVAQVTSVLPIPPSASPKSDFSWN